MGLVVAAGLAYTVVEIMRYDPHVVKSVRLEEGLDSYRFKLRSGDEVWLIGVGLPRKETSGTREPARQLVQKLIEGKHIDIERDKQELDTGKRLLSYVWVKVRGGQAGLDEVLKELGLPTGKVKVDEKGRVFINELVVRLGLLESSPEAPNLKHRDELEAAQAAAKKEGLGMWGEQGS